MARASDLFMDALGVESIIKSCFHFHLRSDPLSGSIKPELLLEAHLMGRTVPTWRNRLERRIEYWRDFKRVLRPVERDSLEDLASAVRRRSSACGMLPLSDEFEPIVLAMLIDINVRLSSLEEENRSNE